MNSNEPPETRALISGVSKYQHCDEIDLGDAECLSHDDLCQNSCVFNLNLSNDIMDIFWVAEITDLCLAGNTWYTELRDYFSEHEYNNYSKYLCYQGDSGFYYCNKDSCTGCTHSCTEKIINEQYVLWENYVQPIVSDPALYSRLKQMLMINI